MVLEPRIARRRPSFAPSGLDEHALTVITQFSDGFVNVGTRQVRRLLGVTARHRWHPAPCELLERADIKIAIVEESLELRHQPRKKTPVLADTVTAHR